MMMQFFKNLERAMKKHLEAVNKLNRQEKRVYRLEDQIEELQKKLDESRWQADQARKTESEANYQFEQAYREAKLYHSDMFPGEPSEVKNDAWEKDFTTRFGWYSKAEEELVQQSAVIMG